MLLLVKDTKFESKSQQQAIADAGADYCFYWSKIQNLKANHNHRCQRNIPGSYCFYWSKIQNLKANHNTMVTSSFLIELLLLVKDTKFESKSQLLILYNFVLYYCFYWSKIQNLKANHNCVVSSSEVIRIAFTGQRYKIWKQITTSTCQDSSDSQLLLLVKDTKFESKSQLTGQTSSMK